MNSNTDEALDRLAKAGVPEDLIAQQKALYEEVDALPADAKRLLNVVALSNVKSILREAALAEGSHEKDALIENADSLITLAGYASTTLRDEAQEYSTGDRRVSSVFEHLQDLVKAVALVALKNAGFTEEQVQQALAAYGSGDTDTVKQVTDSVIGARDDGAIPCGTGPQGRAQQAQAAEDGLSGLYL